jgi:hypothetical protein
MKPRRTLLVVINKKVEWGVLGVADIAVKRVISGFQATPAGGRSWPPATRWSRLPSIWPPGCRRRLRRLSAPVGLTRSFWISSLPLPVRLPRADGVLTGRCVFVDFAVPHDNAKISVGFFEGPDVFQGIAMGESAKQCDQGRFTQRAPPLYRPERRLRATLALCRSAG